VTTTEATTGWRPSDGWWCGWCDQLRSWSTAPGLYFMPGGGELAMLCKRCCRHRWWEMPEEAQRALHHADPVGTSVGTGIEAKD
jgi:hypothetical protein